ncbi:major facilitator superfamily domain-containing protein [Tirmania nivea]|nr:major facilitator superfamily domain-containing protein [Tirmania nivea]
MTWNNFTLQVTEDSHSDNDRTPVGSQAPSSFGGRDPDLENARDKLPASVVEENHDSHNICQASHDLPPPDGGLTAWLQVLGAHALVMVTWGYSTSFGFFQAHYLSLLPSSTPSAISWIGSMQLFCLLFVGTFSGIALDVGYFRWLMAIGSILLLLGIFMTSLATSYYQLFLAHGVCVGLANGCLFVPTSAVVTSYFTTRRGIAIGLMACGAGTGGILFPAIILKLLPRLGFPTTIRILGCVVAFLLCVAACLIRPRIRPRRAKGFIDKTVFRDSSFCLFALGMFFLYLALITPFYYISMYARLLLPPRSTSSTPTTLIMVMNAAGIPGRLISARIADKITGPFNSLIPFAFLSSIILFGWIGVKSVPGLFVFVVFYGYTAAAILALFPYTMNSRITPLNRLGVVSGMVYTFVSFALLIGTPIAGGLQQLDADKPGVEIFRNAQIFSGCMALVAGVLMTIARMMMTNGKLIMWI